MGLPRRDFPPIDFLRRIRDAPPTVEEAIAFLGDSHADHFHSLRKSGRLVVAEGRVHLNPDRLFAGGRCFHWEGQTHIDL